MIKVELNLTEPQLQNLLEAVTQTDKWDCRERWKSEVREQLEIKVKAAALDYKEQQELNQ